MQELSDKRTGSCFPRVIPYSENVIRVVYAPDSSIPDESLIVTAAPMDGAKADVEVQTDETQNLRFYRNGRLLSAVACPVFEPYDIYTESGGSIEIRDTVDGLRSSATGGKKRFVRRSHHASVAVEIDETETLFGLGSHEEGYPCLNGRFVPLYQENMRISLPYFVSNKGYAVLFDCASYMTFDNRERSRADVYLDCADAVDIYFLFGDDFDEICAAYRFLTGETPMLPKWCCGYIQSKEYYKNQQELLEVAGEYRKRGVPLDGIVQDWQYWNDGLWGDKNLDKSRYPDMQGCTDALHRMHIHLIISVWSNLFGDSPNRLELAKKNMLLGDGSVYNAFDGAARAVYWRQANDGLFRYGIDGWWCDSTEPFDAVWDGATRDALPVRMQKSVAEFKKYLDDGVLNAFSIVHSKGIYENQRKTTPEKRVVNITRSALSGQHRYGTIVWSGDISASWETLQKQVRIMQNYIACGEAYWNCDIGGFFTKNRADKWFWSGEYPDGCRDDAYRELYTRWLQFAVFTPMMRSHGTDTPREIWRFGEAGEPNYEAIKAGIKLRYRLLPFFYSVNANVTFVGKMPVKPLALVYPDDEKACNTFDEYLYGDVLLVCPVTEPGVKIKRIYLPEGVWYDFHTDKKYTGGRYIDVPCTLDKIPVFVKAGAILPLAGPLQYADDLPEEPITIRIYPGDDGSFLLYNDDGESYRYEQGQYSRVLITYDDEQGEITVHELADKRFARRFHYEIIR